MDEIVLPKKKSQSSKTKLPTKRGQYENQSSHKYLRHKQYQTDFINQRICEWYDEQSVGKER